MVVLQGGVFPNVDSDHAGVFSATFVKQHYKCPSTESIWLF